MNVEQLTAALDAHPEWVDWCSATEATEPPLMSLPAETADELREAVYDDDDYRLAPVLMLAEAVATTENLTPYDLELEVRAEALVARTSHRPPIAHYKAEHVARVQARQPPPGTERRVRCSAHRLRAPPSSRPLVGAITRHGPPTPIGSRRCLAVT